MKKERFNKLNKKLQLLIWISLILAIIFEIYTQSWFNLFITFLTLFLVFSPYFIEHKYQVDIPDILETIIILFIYASLYLGEVRGFYFHVWWWDLFLHFWSAITLALIGFVLLLTLYETKKIVTKPFWVAFFAFSFALSMGAIWEIFEFSFDFFLRTNMQKSGLFDTMGDLIIDMFGAMIVSISGYFYLKKRKVTYIERFIRKFF